MKKSQLFEHKFVLAGVYITPYNDKNPPASFLFFLFISINHKQCLKTSHLQNL